MMYNALRPSLDALEQSATNKKIAAEGYIHKFVYYVIGLEVVVCGYILTNSSNLSSLGYLLPATYCVCGLAALAGLIYKYLDNNITHLLVYEPGTKIKPWQLKCYLAINSAFFILSSLFLVMLLAAGTYILI